MIHAPINARIQRLVARTAPVLVSLLVAAPAFARPTRPTAHATKLSIRAKANKACMASYNAAQEQEQAGRLHNAMDKYAECAYLGCGSFLNQECTTRHAQLQGDIPSIVPMVTDEKGAPRSLVEVKLDGKVLTSKLDGRAIQVDPGMHEFTFASDSGVLATENVMIVQGQRNRLISISVRSSDGHILKKSIAAIDSATAESSPKVEAVETSTTEGGDASGDLSAKDTSGSTAVDLTAKSDVPKAPNSKLAYALGGTGIAALAAGGLMTYWGRKDNTTLETCTPSCTGGAVNHTHNMYIGADIAFGVGVAALAGSFLLWGPRHVKEADKPEATPTPSQDVAVAVVPTSSGAVGAVSGSF